MKARPTNRGALIVDAAACALMGAALAIFASPLASLTALAPDLLRWAGLLLLPVAGFIAVTALRMPGFRPALWIIVIGNIGWIAASLVVLVLALPNPFGVALLLAQAAAVAVLTVLEARGLAVSSGSAA